MKKKFSVGERVLVPLARRIVNAIVTEDRGPIGVHGRRLYQVRVPADPFDPALYEYPEDEIEPIQTASADVLETTQIINYLRDGGLLTILNANRAGGRTQPRVWLCWDSRGNITHTFTQEYGVVGGATIPFMAIEDDRIFEPKQQEVASFLDSFRLNPLQVQEILRSVGTYPA